jgi:hypothetical protein
MAFQVAIPKLVSTISRSAIKTLELTQVIFSQDVAAVTSDLWPSFSRSLAAPWKQTDRVSTADASNSRNILRQGNEKV